MTNKQTKNIVIGLGGSGSIIADLLSNKMHAICIDTDSYVNKYNNSICLSDNSSVFELALRNENKGLENYFPFSSVVQNQYYKGMNTNKGTHQWRNLGFLMFEDFFSDIDKKNIFNDLFDSLFSPKNNQEIFFVGSLCGGTASALYLPLALYLKDYVKVKFDQEIKIRLVLICPGVYLKNSTKENKEKGYANAYVSLKELNTVEQITKTKEPSLLSFDIPLGKKMLFASNDLSFRDQYAFPFKNIYLFDELPDCDSIIYHETEVVNLIERLSNNTYDTKINKNLYTSIYTQKAVIPFDSICRFLSFRKTYDDFKNEWVNYPSYLEEQINAEKEGSLYRKEEEDTKRFISLLSRRIEEEDENNYLDDLLFHRNNEEDDTYQSTYQVGNIRNFVSNLINKIYNKSINFQMIINFKEIRDLIEDSIKLDNIKLFDNKEVIKQKKDNVIKQIKTYNNVIVDFYSYLKKEYYEKVDDIYNEELQELVNLLFVDENNKYVHPIVALIKLSLAYEYLSDRLMCYTTENDEFFSIIDSNQIGDGILEFKNDYFSKYKTITMIDSEMRKSTYLFVMSMIKYHSYLLLKKTLTVIFNYISDYRQLINRISLSLDSLSLDVREVMREGANSSIAIKNISSDDESKEKIYRYFIKNSELHNDQIYGKNVFDFIVDYKREKNQKITIEKVEELFASLALQTQKYIEETKEVKDICSINIYDALKVNNIVEQEEIDSDELQSKLSNLYRGLRNPLEMKPIDGDDDNNPIYKNQILVSQNTLQSIIKSFGNQERFLLSLDIDCDLICNNNVKDNEIIFARIIDNMALNWFAKVNANSEFNYNRYYQNIIINEKINLSQMWNPNLFVNTNNSVYLKRIDAQEETQYQTMFVTAFLYCIASGEIDVRSEKDNKCYYLCDSPLQINCNGILKDDLQSLLKAFINQEKIILDKSKLFYDLFIKQKEVTKEETFKKLYTNKLFKSLFGLKVINSKSKKELLSNNLLISLFDIKDNSVFSEIFRMNIIKILNSLVEMYYFDEKEEKEEYTKNLLEKLVADGIKQLEDTSRKKEGKAYKTWLISQT